MKVKLDENVPRSVQALLADSGHDVETVSGDGMTGARQEGRIGTTAGNRRFPQH